MSMVPQAVSSKVVFWRKTVLIQIEKALPTDVVTIAEMFDALNDYLAANINYPGWKKGIYPTREDADADVRMGLGYVARQGNETCGYIVLSSEPEASPVIGKWMVDASDNEVLSVHRFVVHPLFMRQGVGTQLLHFADAVALRQSMKALRLDVYEKNIPAIRAYERHGYVYIDTVDIGLSQYGLDKFHLYEKDLSRIHAGKT